MRYILTGLEWVHPKSHVGPMCQTGPISATKTIALQSMHTKPKPSTATCPCPVHLAPNPLLDCQASGECSCTGPRRGVVGPASCADATSRPQGLAPEGQARPIGQPPRTSQKVRPVFPCASVGVCSAQRHSRMHLRVQWMLGLMPVFRGRDNDAPHRSQRRIIMHGAMHRYCSGRAWIPDPRVNLSLTRGISKSQKTQ